MSRFLRWQASFVFLLVWESACVSKRVSVPLPPPPVETAPVPPAPPPPAAAASSQTPAPAPTTPAPELPPHQVNKAPQPAPAAKKPVRAATPPAAPTVPAPTPTTPASPAAPPTPAPKLGDVLTPDEQRQYNAAIDQSLAHAQASLNAIGSRQLNNDQQGQMEQIRDFIKQAQGTRTSDPPGAKSLAERAEVLARDLAASFH